MNQRFHKSTNSPPKGEDVQGAHLDKTFTLIGHGSQGKAWSSNLRDSGFKVNCYLRNGSKSFYEAKESGLALCNDLSNSDVILLLIPDQAHKTFFEENHHKLREGAIVIYAHGASLTENGWQNLYPNFDHILLAPKAIASEVRNQYLTKGKLGAVYSLEFSSEGKRSLILSIAKGIGITAGPFEVTFEQETRADLLSEQSLLCGLIPYAAKKCFDYLIAKGIPKELAYMEAWHEVKLIATAMDKLGPEEFFHLISPHAFTGAIKAKDRLLNNDFDGVLDDLYQDITDGTFFKETHEKELDKIKTQELNIWKNSELQRTYASLKDQL